MKKHYALALACILSLLSAAQVNIKVRVSQVAVLGTQDCDAGAADNSDFLFEFMANDNSAFAYSNNSPVAGSIGPCNYVYIPENNGSYSITPAAPGGGSFNPSNGLFFDRLYSCKHDVPTQLTFKWAGYENDDTGAPSTVPVANGQTGVQTNTFSIPAATGTYTMQYTSTSPDGGCPQTYMIRFAVDRSTGSFSPLSIDDLDQAIACTGLSNGQLNPSIAGGSGTVLFDWSNDGTNDFDDTQMLSNIPSGTYTLVVKDGLNCTDTAVGLVTSQDAPASVSFSASSPSLCTGQPMLFSVNAQTVTSSYTWAYSSGGVVISSAANNATLSALTGPSTGTLSVYAQNSCSVSNTATMAITVVQTPSLVVNGNLTICDNASEILTAGGANTYTWDSGASTASISVSPTTTTVYTVTGASNGCAVSTTFTLSTTPSPTFQVNGPSAAVCPTQTVTAGVSGNGTNYIWSDGFVGTTHTFSSTATEVYTVTGVSNNGCFTQETYTLHVNSYPAVLISGNTAACLNSIQSYTASGADTYVWSTSSTAPVISMTVTNATTLSVTGTNTLTGCVASNTLAVQQYPQPNLAINGNKFVCGGSSTILTGSGADFYHWSTGATASTETVTVFVTTTITVVGTNINGGCKDSTYAVINVTPQPTITVSGIDSLCAGQSAVLSASGALNYSWSTGAVMPSITVTPTATTVYTVTSLNGSCSDSKTHEVAVKPLPAIDFSGNRTCVDDAPFALNATPAGGAYNGSGISGNMFNPQVSGTGVFAVTYSVTSHGCSASTQSTVEVLSCTGIDELSEAFSVNIYPNPGNGIVHVRSSGEIKAIVVSDLSGRIIQIVQSTAKEETIDISREQPGLYLFNIRLNGGVSRHYKVIKQ